MMVGTNTFKDNSELIVTIVSQSLTLIVTLMVMVLIVVEVCHIHK